MAVYYPNVTCISQHLLLVKAASGETHAARTISALMVDMVIQGEVVAQEVTEGVGC